MLCCALRRGTALCCAVLCQCAAVVAVGVITGLIQLVLMCCFLQLMSALVDAAERLRQFSPVKENISAAVLEEVRWRLYRIVSVC